MRKLQLHGLGLLVLVGLLAWSQKGWAGPFPEFSTYDTAWDTYVPDGHPMDNPSNQFGTPPPLGTYAGTYGPSSEGWFDGRNGESGIYGRWPAGTGYNGPGNGGESITTLNGKGGYGVKWATPLAYGYGLGDMDFGRPSKQANNVVDAGRYIGGGDNLGGLAKWSFQNTMYLQSSGTVRLGSGDAYNPDYWWTNAIGDSTTGSYATETGITPRHETSGLWNFNTTGGGVVAAGVTSGQWVTMEVRYDFSNTQLAAIHNLWAVDADGTPTALLGSHTLTALFQNPTSAGTQGGPRYSWTTVVNSSYTSYDHITLQAEGVGTPLAIGVFTDWYVAPSPTHGLKGDMNNDAAVNNFDISPFELALTDSTTYLATYGGAGPGGFIDDPERIYRGDINNDSAFDNFDISPFEQLLTGPGPLSIRGAEVPEPSTFVLLVVGGLGLVFARRYRVKK